MCALPAGSTRTPSSAARECQVWRPSMMTWPCVASNRTVPARTPRDTRRSPALPHTSLSWTLHCTPPTTQRLPRRPIHSHTRPSGEHCTRNARISFLGRFTSIDGNNSLALKKSATLKVIFFFILRCLLKLLMTR